MPRRTRPGKWAVIFAEVPPELKARLEAQAEANHRSATGELIAVLSEHLSPIAGSGRKKRDKKAAEMS